MIEQPVIRERHGVTTQPRDDATMALTRRCFLEAAGIGAAALAIPPLPAFGGVGGGWDEPAYLAFADAMQPLLSGAWSHDAAHYLGGDGGQTSMNANLLFTHATAAVHGHSGPCRQDERARMLAMRLCEAPPWRPPARSRATAALDQTHEHGWGSTMGSQGGQHVVIDAAVIRGLAQAHRARERIGLSPAEAATIAGRIRGCAYATFYEFPAMRLNQVNWPVEIYANAAAVLGDSHLLRHDLRLQLERFAWHMTRADQDHQTPFLGPGYRFHYLPQYDARHPFNLDSAEYANIVCGVLRFYEQAVRAGMRPLNDRQVRRLRAWVERVLCGYWTHAGYLNWDTGLGFLRWHQSKKLGLAQMSLLAIATSERFQPSPAYGRWAKWMFDRGLEFYARCAAEAGGLPPPVFFGVRRTSWNEEDPPLAAARMQANAMIALDLGLGLARSEQPPPLYAYDPDIGRLAVTTPRYNTALLAVNQGAVPYGGMEPARLFDGDQRVAAGVGGRPPASFGVTVIDHDSGRSGSSQRGRERPDRRDPPLRLVRAPRKGSAPYPVHAYAGPFREIESAGSTEVPGAVVHSRQRFRRSHIECSWRILPRGRRSRTVRVTFPTTGPGATVVAVTRSGQRRRLPVPIAEVAWFELRSADGAYVVVPRTRSLPGHARLLYPRPQSSAPSPGPTLALEVARRSRRSRPLTVTVRMAPVMRGERAGRVASRLMPRARR